MSILEVQIGFIETIFEFFAVNHLAIIILVLTFILIIRLFNKVVGYWL